VGRRIAAAASRAGLLLAIAGTLAAGLALASPARGTATACKPGVTTLNGVSVRVFCGPAKATVHVKVGSKAPKTYTFKNGQCDRYPKYFDANIGTVALGFAKKKPLYFGLLMGKSPAATSKDPVVAKDGTYKGGLITIGTGTGASYTLHGTDQLTITLKKGRRAGSFVGKRPGSTLFNQSALSVTGSFTC
jgi:hypothetical protein